MMKFDTPLYFENAEKMIYRLKDFEVKGNGIAYLYLDLKCGYDYVDPDNFNLQGYVPKDNFTEEAQHDMISCDLMAESIIKALNDNGYRILNTLPKIFSKGLGR